MEYRVIQMDEHTWRIEEYSAMASVYMYLLEGEEKALLIDTGFGTIPLKQIVEEYTQKPVSVILTHGHVDHIGGTSFFENVWIHPADRLVYEEHGTKEVRSIFIDLEQAWYPVGEKLLDIDENRCVDLGGRLLSIVDAPGHTKGSVCVYDEARKWLFTGDTCCEADVLLQFEHSDTVETFKNTINSLKGIDFTDTWPAHHKLPVKRNVLDAFEEAAQMICDGTIAGIPESTAWGEACRVDYKTIGIVYCEDRVHNRSEEKADVVVIGSGAAGMMAAVTAAKKGLSCIVLEKGADCSVSNVTKAGGPALAGTKLQATENVTLTVDELYQHMYGFARGTVNAGLLRRALEKGYLVEEIFTECGIEAELLPDSYGAGFRARHFFKCFGKKRWQPLVDFLEQRNGKVCFGQCAQRLVLEDGKVTGVVAENVETKEVKVYRGKAVIIATGGYLGNREMIKEHFGDINVIPLGSTLSDGAGIKMAMEAGGYLDRNWGICSNEFGGANCKLLSAEKRFSSNLLYAITGGLLVNGNGERFMNEQHLSDEALSIGGEAVLREGKFYAVLDEGMYQALKAQSVYDFYGRPAEWYVGKTVHSQPPRNQQSSLEEDIKNGWAFCADTVAEVAKKAGLLHLEKTVGEYNELCESDAQDPFGKAKYLCKAICKAPFYVFEYEASAWCTFGGVKTDAYCRLLNRENAVIDGVYVAGVDNGSCYCVPYYDNEGAALGIAFTTGIVAGEQAAEYCKRMSEWE